MIQLNVHLGLGQMTHDGHRLQGWGAFHVELFDEWTALRIRQEYWRERGVKAELGKLSRKLQEATLPEIHTA